MPKNEISPDENAKDDQAYRLCSEIDSKIENEVKNFSSLNLDEEKSEIEKISNQTSENKISDQIIAEDKSEKENSILENANETAEIQDEDTNNLNNSITNLALQQKPKTKRKLKIYLQKIV